MLTAMMASVSTGRITVGFTSRIGIKNRFLFLPATIMAIMDTTQTEKMLSDLEEADAAEAPDIADELTSMLTEQLEASSPPKVEKEPREEAP